MQVVIIEDEKPSARRLQRLLNAMDVKAEVMLHSVEESIDWFSSNKHPDLIFLDVQLSDGLSFEIFEQVEIDSAIIFTTAYDAYALQAFKLNSIDYLLKPIDKKELEQAVDQFKKRNAEGSNLNVNLQELRSLIGNQETPHYKKRFSIKVGQHLKLINSSDIECFYSENKGTYLYTAEGRNYLLDATLEALEKELDPDMFFRISRKYYVNINAIRDMISYTNSRLQIKLNHYNENDVIVARERVKDFKKWLE
ncbi:MAG: response regulator transcription factor [Flavobacteriaceae bacterium]|nr:response regulator transcription factor [Flavobacteriaceae bacterium]